MGKMNWSFFGLFIIALIYGLTVNAISAGFVISKLWLWFMVPLGLKVITIFHSLGIGTVISAFTMGLTMLISSNRKENQDYMSGVVLIFVMPLAYFIVLFFGWIYHLLMVTFPNF